MSDPSPGYRATARKDFLRSLKGQPIGYLPTRLLCRFKYDTLSHVKKIHCPVLIAHSRDDKTVPFEHGRRLFEAANKPKVFVEMRGDHNSGGLDVDPDCQQVLSTFIGTYVKPSAKARP